MEDLSKHLKRVIVLTKLDDNDGNKISLDPTTDKVFIESYDELLDRQENYDLYDFATDYAVMNGIRMSENSADYYKRNAEYWTRTAHFTGDNKKHIVKVNGNGTFSISGMDAVHNGIMPCIALDCDFVKNNRDELKVQEKTDGKREYVALYFGEYPKTYVGDAMQTALNSIVNNSGVKRFRTTGKKYIGKFENGLPTYNNEYVYSDGSGDKKYVLVKCFSESSNSEISDGTTIQGRNGQKLWVRVEPICWKITNWDKLPKTINPDGDGTADKVLLKTEEIINAGIPFYKDYRSMNDNGYLWQNSTIRGYLNGINVNMVNYLNGATDGGDFTEHNFLAEAFDCEKDKFIEEEKTVVKMQPTNRKNRYNIQVEDDISTKDQIAFYIKNGMSFMLHGPSGVGKTRRIEEADPNLVAIVLRNGILPEEIIGKTIYPNINDTTSGTWVPPSWYNDLCKRCEAEPDKNHILFIDEITNVKPNEQSLVFHLILSHSIGPNYGKLPKNAVVVAAGNNPEESDAAYNMPEPLFRRFSGHIYLKPDLEEWLEWGSELKANGTPKIHPLVSAFVAANAKTFYSKYDSEQPPKYAIDPRGWEQLSDIVYQNNGRIAKQLIENKVGSETAIAFMAFAANPPLAIEDVMEGTYLASDIPSGSTEKYALAMSLRGANESQVETVRNFISDNLGNELLATFDIAWIGENDERAILINDLITKSEEETLNQETQESDKTGSENAAISAIAYGNTSNTTKAIIDIDEFFDTNKILEIHTDEEWKAIILTKVFYKMGKKWCGGSDYSKTNYSYYKKDTHYNNKGEFGAGHTYCDMRFKFDAVDLTKYLDQADIDVIISHGEKIAVKDENLESFNKNHDVKKITLDEFFASSDKLAIHCDEEWKAIALTKCFAKMGRVWSNSESYAGNTKYQDYGDKTCYTNRGTRYKFGSDVIDNIEAFDFSDVDISKYLKEDEIQMIIAGCIVTGKTGAPLSDDVKQGYQDIIKNTKRATLNEVMSNKQTAIWCEEKWQAEILRNCLLKIGKGVPSGLVDMSYGDETCYTCAGIITVCKTAKACGYKVYNFEEVDFSEELTNGDAKIIIDNMGTSLELEQKSKNAAKAARRDAALRRMYARERAKQKEQEKDNDRWI